MYLLFDIGGTNIRLATSLDGNNLLSTKTIPTNLDFNEAILEIEKNVKEMTGGKSIDFAAGGVRALYKTKTKLLNLLLIKRQTFYALQSEKKKVRLLILKR